MGSTRVPIVLSLDLFGKGFTKHVQKIRDHFEFTNEDFVKQIKALIGDIP